MCLHADEARLGVSIKAKRPEARKPYAELKVGPSQSHRLGKLVDRRRLIDRANDRYIEEVREYESGQLVHKTDEALSHHIGHGSAKKPT